MGTLFTRPIAEPVGVHHRTGNELWPSRETGILDLVLEAHVVGEQHQVDRGRVAMVVHHDSAVAVTEAGINAISRPLPKTDHKSRLH